MSAHDDLLKALLSDYDSRRSRNVSFSLRAYARFLGIQPSGLSDILNGKRKVSRKMGAKIIARLPIQPHIATEISRSLKGKYDRAETDPKRKFVVLERSTFEVMSNWYYMATLTLSELDGFEGTSSWIAKRLGIPRKKADGALKQLTALGLLTWDQRKKKLVATHKNLATTTDIPHLALQRSHQEHLELASSGLHEIPVENRDFSWINMATDPSLIPEAKMRIRKFRRELCGFLERSQKKTAVFRLGIQFFPLTKGLERKRGGS